MQSISRLYKSDHIIEKASQSISSFLDKHPDTYKVVLFACHLFRAAGMYGFMMISPVPMMCAVATAGSLLYRASVERFCCFRFALPSLAGAGALWISRIAMIRFVAGTIFSSMSSAALCMSSVLSLGGYLGYIAYVSHREYEEKMGSQNGCCRSTCELP